MRTQNPALVRVQLEGNRRARQGSFSPEPMASLGTSPNSVLTLTSTPSHLGSPNRNPTDHAAGSVPPLQDSACHCHQLSLCRGHVRPWTPCIFPVSCLMASLRLSAERCLSELARRLVAGESSPGCPFSSDKASAEQWAARTGKRPGMTGSVGGSRMGSCGHPEGGNHPGHSQTKCTLRPEGCGLCLHDLNCVTV